MADRNEKVCVRAMILHVREKAYRIQAPWQKDWIAFSVTDPEDHAAIRQAAEGDFLDIRIPRWIAERLDLIG